MELGKLLAVSYTHLDVYKRQAFAFSTRLSCSMTSITARAAEQAR